MRLEIDHTLTLTLPPGTSHAVLHLMLTPVSGPTQAVSGWVLEGEGIDGAGRFSDAYGNLVHLVNLSRPEGEVRLAARGLVETTDRHGVLGKPAGEPVPALYKRVTPLTKAPVTLYGKFRHAAERRLDILHALMARVGETLGMPLPDGEPGQMQADGSQTQSQGADEPPVLPPPQDYAHLFIGAARALDIPARYVTGYRAGDDARLYAWAEAYDEALGWIGFDPRLQICTTERHVRLAIGLDAESATPVRTVPVGDLAQTVSIRGG